MNTAVVTGASSGIGQKTAELLLKNGWKVYGIARSDPGITNGNFVWLQCDLADSRSIEFALESISETVIDVLFSNAGVAFEELASDVTEDSYQKMFSVNVLAPMLLVHSLKNKLTKATIISVSSVSDRITDKTYALYCSSKAANTRYFESLAQQWHDAKIINLLPDYVDTPMLRELQAGRDFKWKETIKADDLAGLSFDIISGKISIESGSNIIVVNNAQLEDLKSIEKLYGFNTDTADLTKLY